MAGGRLTDPLPHWLIVGTPKSGTTTLAEWLRGHPEVCVSPAKELEFFDRHWNLGMQWYASQFPGRAAGLRCGEATAAYVYSDVALDRIRATAADVRLLLLLREPVSRLWSQAWFMRMLGSDPRSFDRILRDERRHPDRRRFGLPVGYLESSRYAARLRALYDRFPRDQVLVLFFDDLLARPVRLWGDVCRHLGVDPTLAVPRDRGAVNPTTVPHSVWLQFALVRLGRSRLWQALPGQAPRRTLRTLTAVNAAGPRPPEMPEPLRRQLAAEYRDDLAELEQLIGRPLPAGWRDG